MSEEEDYIIVTVEDDSDGNDIDVVIMEDSETELTENTLSTDGMLTVEPNCRASNDNYQQLSQMTYGVGGLPPLGDQAVPQMNHLANLKRYSSNSVEMELLPLRKRGRTSFPRRDNTGLQELIENTNKQVNNLCGIISKIQPSWEKPPLPNCEDGGPSRPVRRQENLARPNPVRIALQPATLPELQELVVRESPPPPKIVSTYSLQPSVIPGNPVPGFAVLSYIFSEGGEGATRDLSSVQLPLALPAALLPPEEPRVAHAPKMARCPTVRGQGRAGPGPASSAFCTPPSFEMPRKAEASLGNSTESIYCPTSLGDGSGQDTISSVYILPNFVIAETSLENNPKPTNYPTSSGNNGDQCSAICLPPNFAVEKFILIKKSEKSETSQENSSETIYYPALLGSLSGPDTDSSSASLPPNFGLEKVILVEMPEKAETSLEISSQIVCYQTSSGNDSGSAPASSSLSIPLNFGMMVKAQTSPEENLETMSCPVLLEDGGNQDVSSLHCCIPPSFEVMVKAETGLENSTQMTNYQPLLENDSGQETSAYFFIPSSLESSVEVSSETMSSPTLMKHDSDQDTDSETYFLAPGFALLPVEILVKAENSVENVPEIMNYPAVLEKDKSQDSVSSSSCIPSGFGYLGDPRRNVRVLNINLVTAQKKSHPRHAARYLVHVLFSKEILMHSWVGFNSQGRQPLDPNKMAAIREYLATNFPNHDLRECGKDWKTCIADINSLIYCLCAEATTTPKAGGCKKGPTSLGIPASADVNDERGGKGGKSISQLSQPTAASGTREKGNFQWKSSVCHQGIKEPSMENSVVSDDILEYLGNPGRNVQLPHSVLNIAKGRSRPELAARYLIRKLFTEDVLVKSNVYGNLGYGMNALNPNRINALREFLQDIFPTCNLSETGYNWKLCVTAINSSIRSLRYDLKKSAFKA
ncbi:BEN domain-containing protein 2 isoform X1 [Callorhinus ursinus]|uniref:BEN domain-containing protein 2 isoform X1 n=2 Tax=Callorhinus ursinus TaxID=34884 RepID=UPI003CD01779